MLKEACPPSCGGLCTPYFRKAFQRRLYTFLSSRVGLVLLFIGFILTVNSGLQLGKVAFQKVRSDRTNGPTPPNVLLSNSVAASVPKYLGNAALNALHEPIDIVYTWVNGSDPKHSRSRLQYKAVWDAFLQGESNDGKVSEGAFNASRDEATLQNRYRDNNELIYSLRSVEKFAPWVRHIYLVTNGQIPTWLNVSHPKLTIVPHSSIFPPEMQEHLPTFSSPAIETHLHRIPGLSKRFLYLNDDTMFGNEIWPEDFYTRSKGQKVYLAWGVPYCAPSCPPSWIGDGYCDRACNTSECDWDGGDCLNVTESSSSSSSSSRWSPWRTQRNNYCATGCPTSWLGDHMCDTACKTLACAYDAGDCGAERQRANMIGLNVTANETAFDLPINMPALYIDLAALVGARPVVEASHDYPDIVRSATISQRSKLLSVTLYRNSLNANDSKLAEEHPNATLGFDVTFTIKAGPLLNADEGSSEAQNAYYQFNLTVLRQNITAIGKDYAFNVSSVEREDFPSFLFPEDFPMPDEPAPEPPSWQYPPTPPPQPPTTTTPPRYPPYTQPAGEDEEGIEEQLITLLQRYLNVIQSRRASRSSTTYSPPSSSSSSSSSSPSAPSSSSSFSSRTAQRVRDNASLLEQLKQYRRSPSSSSSRTPTPTPAHPRTSTPTSTPPPESTPPPSRPSTTQSTFLHDLQRQLRNARSSSSSSLAQRELSTLLAALTATEGPKESNVSLVATVTDSPAESGLTWEEEEALELMILQVHGLQGTSSSGSGTPVPSSPAPPSAPASHTAGREEEEEHYPWEDSLPLLVEPQRKRARVQGGHGVSAKRELSDVFADSLRTVNKLYTREFGANSRKVPAHMPHMIDRDIMDRLQTRWPEHFERTSSHRFRHGSDMQYAFSYFYFLMEERDPFNLTVLFQDIDRNGDGYLNDNELHLLALKLDALHPMSTEELKKRIYLEATGQWDDSLESEDADDHDTYAAPGSSRYSWSRGSGSRSRSGSGRRSSSSSSSRRPLSSSLTRTSRPARRGEASPRPSPAPSPAPTPAPSPSTLSPSPSVAPAVSEQPQAVQTPAATPSAPESTPSTPSRPATRRALFDLATSDNYDAPAGTIPTLSPPSSNYRPVGSSSAGSSSSSFTSSEAPSSSSSSFSSWGAASDSIKVAAKSAPNAPSRRGRFVTGPPQRVRKPAPTAAPSAPSTPKATPVPLSTPSSDEPLIEAASTPVALSTESTEEQLAAEHLAAQEQDLDVDVGDEPELNVNAGEVLSSEEDAPEPSTTEQIAAMHLAELAEDQIEEAMGDALEAPTPDSEDLARVAQKKGEQSGSSSSTASSSSHSSSSSSSSFSSSSSSSSKHHHRVPPRPKWAPSQNALSSSPPVSPFPSSMESTEASESHAPTQTPTPTPTPTQTPTPSPSGNPEPLTDDLVLASDSKIFRPISTNGELLWVTADILERCTALMKRVNESTKGNKRNKFEVMQLEDVAFVMVNDNHTTMQSRFDDILVKRNKFVCLNDDMNNTNIKVLTALQNFYTTYFPAPSTFELADDARNPFTTFDEYLEWAHLENTLRQSARVRRLAYALLFGVLLAFAAPVVWRLWLSPFARHKRGRHTRHRRR